jgi:hypothetical protein
MRLVTNGQTSTMTAVQSMSKPPALAIDLNGPAFDGKGRMVVVNNIVYVSMKSITPAGKYLKLDPKDKSNPMAGLFSQLLNQMDPTKTFDAFDHGLKSVKHVGTDTVDGTKVDHYKVAVDTAAALKAQKQKVPAGMPKTITYDIWMDAAHLMRRLTFAMQGARMEMKASGWGEPVTIKAPAAADIVKP